MEAFTYPDWSILPLLYAVVAGWILLLAMAVALEVTTYAFAHNPLGHRRHGTRGA